MRSLRITLLLAMALVCMNTTNAQIRRDSLYESILDGNVDALRLELESGLSADQELAVPSHRLISPERSESHYLLEVSFLAENDDASLLLLQAGADTSLLEGRLGGYSVPTTMAMQGLSQTLDYWIERNLSKFLSERGLPLLAAVYYGRIDTADMLLARMQSLFSQDDLQQVLDDALVRAIATGLEERLVDRLLDAGASPEAYPVLVSAVANCYPETVEKLLQFGLDPNQSYENRPLVHYAFRCFNVVREEPDEAATRFARIVVLLHSAGSDVCSSIATFPVDRLTPFIIEKVEELRVCD